MSRPLTYDSNSPDEQPVLLPSAPLMTIAEGIVLQPPLTRRGTGPGLIAFLPPDGALKISPKSGHDKPLDPVPVVKWAEEGFAVIGITTGHASVRENLNKSVNALLNLKELDIRDKIAVAVYDPEVLVEVGAAIPNDPRLCCLVVYGYPLVGPPPAPTLIFLPSGSPPVQVEPNVNLTVFPVNSPSPSFVLPQTVDFHNGAASIAHSKAAVHFKKHLGGPFFDLEAIWDEHTYFEFEVRSVAKTMGTMVVKLNRMLTMSPPQMTGGVGREQLSAFYRDHFIFSNPKDLTMQAVSRTVGSDRVVDEFVLHTTHDKTIDWLLPGVPPTGKKLSIPMLGVINIRGDRLYHEHIWWDQATACRQAGIISNDVSFNGKTLRLPIAGAESARMLIDERSLPSNEMLGPGYGFIN